MLFTIPKLVILKLKSPTVVGHWCYAFAMMGVVFHPKILEQGRPGHYGLPGMRERAKQVGGKVDIWSAEGAGTEIEFSIAASIAYGTSPGRTLFHVFRKKQGEL